MLPQCVISIFRPSEENLVQSSSEAAPCTFDFFGEFHALSVVQWPTLLLNVANVQHFAHEINDGLRFVERRCTD